MTILVVAIKISCLTDIDGKSADLWVYGLSHAFCVYFVNFVHTMFENGGLSVV